MKVHGNRVYLDLPEIEINPQGLTIPTELKRQRQAETISRLDRLTVFAVGEGVTNIKPGDEVFLDPIVAKRGLIVIEINGKEKGVVSSFEIAHTW